MHHKYAFNIINYMINHENNALVFEYHTRLTENNLYALFIEKVSKLWNLLAENRIIGEI